MAAFKYSSARLCVASLALQYIHRNAGPQASRIKDSHEGWNTGASPPLCGPFGAWVSRFCCGVGRQLTPWMLSTASLT